MNQLEQYVDRLKAATTGFSVEGIERELNGEQVFIFRFSQDVLGLWASNCISKPKKWFDEEVLELVAEENKKTFADMEARCLKWVRDHASEMIDAVYRPEEKAALEALGK